MYTGSNARPLRFAAAVMKPDIKGGVVRHEREIANKIQKRAHGLRLARRAVHVAVGDAGELHDLRRNGHAGIDERLKALCHDAIFHAHRADLGDAVNVAVQAVVSISKPTKSVSSGRSLSPWTARRSSTSLI